MDRQAYLQKRSEQVSRLSEALTVLNYVYPLYWAIACQLGQMDATGEIDTMAVGFMKDDPVCYLFYNVHFLAECSDEKLRFALMHELLHVGLCHPLRGKGMDAQVANLAMDLVVNESHIREYKKLKPEEQDLIVLNQNPFKWIRDEDGNAKLVPNPEAGQMMFPCLKDLTLRDATMDEIYVRLMSNPDEVKGFLRSKSSYRPGEHTRFSGKPTNKGLSTIDADPLTEEQKSMLDKITEEAFQRLRGRSPGNVPGELQRRLRDFLHPVVEHPWKRELTMFAQTVLRDERQRTWRRYNRRYGACAPGHVKEYRARLLLIIDNSGSIGDAYKEFMAHAVKISELLEEVRVIGCDTRINFEGTLKNGVIPQIRFGHSGGGTDMQPAFDYAKKNKFDGVICLTDGFMGTPDSYKIPTLFAICNGGAEVEGFRNTHLGKGEAK